MNQIFYELFEDVKNKRKEQVNEMIIPFVIGSAAIWIFTLVSAGISLGALFLHFRNAYYNDPIWKHCKKSDNPSKCRSKARIIAARKLLAALIINYKKFKLKKNLKAANTCKKAIEAQKRRIDKWVKKHKEKYNESV